MTPKNDNHKAIQILCGTILFLVAATVSTLAMIENAHAIEIVTREDWGAKQPITKRTPAIKQGSFGKTVVRAENSLPLRDIPLKYITIHHVKRKASTDPVSVTMQKFQTQMRDYYIGLGNGRKLQIYLADIPYHFFIHSTGVVAEGRPLKYAAYSNTEYATPIEQHITVVLDGDFDTTKPNAVQLSALERLLIALAQTHNISADNISWHAKVASSDCPGKNLIPLLPEIIATVRAQNGR